MVLHLNSRDIAKMRSMEEEIIKVAGKALTLTTALKLAKAFGESIKPGFEELGLLIQDKVRSWRFRNQINTLLKARDFLDKKGINPQQVPLKVLAPLLENCSLEEEESMQNRWAALLANAADPNFEEEIRPSFTSILKDLSPKDASILDGIFGATERMPREDWFNSGAVANSIKASLNLSDTEFEIAVDNLYRLQLCRPPSTRLDFIDNKERQFQLQTKVIVCITELGHVFVKACRVN